MGDNNYNPRFFLHHHEFIKTTVTLKDEEPNITEMQFTIHGDPLPQTRSAYNEQYYSPEEIDLWQFCIADLIVGHIFVPFLPLQELQVEIFYHIRNRDNEIPEDSLYSLSEELVQAMTGVFYRDVNQVAQIITYKAASTNDEGMTMIVMKNEIDNYAENDFDNT